MSNEEKKNLNPAEFLHKVGDVSKKAAGEVAKGTKAVYEKVKDNSQKRKIERTEDRYNRRMRKYNPLSEEEFRSNGFNIPNIIEIVDEATRRDIDVCVDMNAIGWRDMINDTEVLHLYDEFVNQSGIHFVPVAKCNGVYCVDPYDRTRFINVDCIFSKANEEKIAELERVANYLGAKKCSIEIVENIVEREKLNVGAKIAGPKKTNANMTSHSDSSHKISHSSKTESTFEGSDFPRKPDLKWFSYDDNITGLIEMRCSGNNSVKYKVLYLKGSTSAAMNTKVAAAVDKICKMGASVSIEKQASKEHNSTLVFEVEF